MSPFVIYDIYSQKSVARNKNAVLLVCRNHKTWKLLLFTLANLAPWSNLLNMHVFKKNETVILVLVKLKSCQNSITVRRLNSIQAFKREMKAA